MKFPKFYLKKVDFRKLLRIQRVNRPRPPKIFFQKLFLLGPWCLKTCLSTKKIFRMTLLTRWIRMTYIYMSKSSILTFFTLERFWKFSENKSSLSACASESPWSKDSKNGFKILLSLKLTELEYFEISKIFLEKGRFSRIAPYSTC